jgi:UDP-2,4-diacetamido-2,4,6-trideoxy-beta-L-altropyranose hydrolase
MIPPLIIRPDVGPVVGLGHLMRCLALAQAWRERGGRVIATLGPSAAQWRDRIEAAGAEVRVMSGSFAEGPSAEEVAAVAQLESAACVVLDGYRFDAAYADTLRSAGVPLALLDDNGSAAAFRPDYIINHNPFASDSMYAHASEGCRLLAGCAYTLLRREFTDRRADRTPLRDDPLEVLLTLGGGESGDLAVRVISAIRDALPDPGVSISVASGPLAATGPSESKAARTQWLSDVWDLAPFMARADIAVSAAGVTSWELAFMGVPAVLLVRSDNQIPVARFMSRRRAAYVAGPVGPRSLGRLRSCVARISGRQVREGMQRRGRSLIDGHGADRVARVLAGGRLRLRPAGPADSRLLWRWANDPLVRANSFTQARIPWAVHQQWLAGRLSTPGTAVYIAHDADENAVGQTRIEATPAGVVVGLSIAAPWRGRGLAAELLTTGAAKYWATHGAAELHAYVKTENAASAKSFASAGYALRGVVRVATQEAVHYVLQPSSSAGSS